MPTVAEIQARYKADQAAKLRNNDPNAIEHGSIAVTPLGGSQPGQANSYINLDNPVNRPTPPIVPQSNANEMLVKSPTPDFAALEAQRLGHQPTASGQTDVPVVNTAALDQQRLNNQPTATGEAVAPPLAPAVAPPDPNDLTGLIDSKYKDLLNGNNAALAQGRRTALTGIGQFENNARSQAAEKAAASGFAPGSPEFQKILQGAEDNVVSQGSALLGQVNQAGLDANNQALIGAAGFNTGQQNFGLNSLQNSQNQGYRYDVLNSNNAQNTVQNTLARDTLNANTNASTGRLGLDTLIANSDIGYKGTMLTDAEKQAKITSYDDIISHPDLYSTAQIAQAKDARAGLLGGVGTGGAPDPSEAQQALNGILDSVKIRYPEMTPVQQEAKARELYGTIDEAQWKSLRDASADPAKAKNGWGDLIKKWFGDNTGLNGMFKNPIESLSGIFHKVF